MVEIGKFPLHLNKIRVQRGKKKTPINRTQELSLQNIGVSQKSHRNTFFTVRVRIQNKPI